MTKVFSYSSMGTWTRIQDMGISLPVTKSGEIDYDFMENYISAQKKLTMLPVLETLKNDCNNNVYTIDKKYGIMQVAEK